MSTTSPNKMRVFIDGHELTVNSVDLTIERDGPPADLADIFPLQPATFRAQLKVDPTFELERLLQPRRKLVWQWSTAEQMEMWRRISTKLEINFAGVRWEIYRRDYRLRRVHMREVLDK